MQNKFKNEKGEVAVLYSPGYGAGWYSWNSTHSDCLFNPELVQLVLEKEKLGDPAREDDVQKIQIKAMELYGEGFYSGGAKQLTIEWIAEGTSFKVNEYDGFESIDYGDSDWIVA